MEKKIKMMKEKMSLKNKEPENIYHGEEFDHEGDILGTMTRNQKKKAVK